MQIDYNGGVINFSQDSMHDVVNSAFKTYDEYLDVQMKSCGKARKYFEICYYFETCHYSNFSGQLLRFDNQSNKAIFNRIMINGMYDDGIGFYGKEDHVWMEKEDFAQFEPSDCINFNAEIYRYRRMKNGRLIDYGIRKPTEITRIDSYSIPTDEQLIDQQINQLVCETCKYYDNCFMGNCIANEQERKERFNLLKNFQPGKFTPTTVALAYELEYRMLQQTGGIKLDEKDPNYVDMKKFADICNSQPIYYVGSPEEAIARMLHPEKPRIYINNKKNK